MDAIRARESRFARFPSATSTGSAGGAFLDAIFLNVRPKGPKEGVLCAWGFTEQGERVLVGVCLGKRESHEDWLFLARDLIARGLPAPMMVVADGAPGLIKAVEQCWPASDRQHCSVHRARNLIAKLPEQQRERVRRAYWQALDQATDERDATQRLATLVAELERAGYASAARCLSDDLDALVVHLRYPLRHRKRSRSTNLLERTLGEVKRRTNVIGRFPGEESCDLQINNACNGVKLLRHRPPQALPTPPPAGGFRRRGQGGDCGLD